MPADHHPDDKVITRHDDGPLPDAEVRALAETTFNRNVVVVAGAGTGKTTLLANRLIHLLMREPGPTAVTEIVALTFTNKAASEMKMRLRERLMALHAPNTERAADLGAVTAEELRSRYGLTIEQITQRASVALRDLEKAQIGTLHSFAAHLLRLHPIESGVDPEFQEDDGMRFEEVFSRYWARWLDTELGAKGRHHAVWRRLLSESALPLEQLRDFARALCSELVPLEELIRQTEQAQLTPLMRDWFGTQRERALALLATHDRPKRRRAEESLAAAEALFASLGIHGVEGVYTLEKPAQETLLKNLGEAPQGWTAEEFAECRDLVGMAKRVLSVDRTSLTDLLVLLRPVVLAVRAAFLHQGWISFDGLLARARALLRDHPEVRERLKRSYRAVLVDEFQDTDPSQYELILYLAERLGVAGQSWQDLDLAPGKLFIVGDPKQSIYAFRRADIEAFDQVVRKVQASGGVLYELVTNFRSHVSVLEVVNACFDQLFQAEENVQPANVPLRVRPGRPAGLSQPGVMLRLVRSEDASEEFHSEAASRVEAEHLAAWLKERLDHATAPLHPGHVALLFRKLTQAQEYLDALRRHGIQYLTDGEKHFFRRQEIVDLINVLRVVENPQDSVALVGVLRSPLGGVTDPEIYDLWERQALDSRAADRLSGWSNLRAGVVRSLYAELAALHEDVSMLALPDVLDRVFQRLPIRELAAASLHGEQAVANLLKLRQMAAELADRPHVSLTGFVELMIQQLADRPEEPEGALAEESLDAVRVMTIHKAKGLEFPLVILPGLHHGASGNTSGREDSLITYDWATGVYGIAIGERCNLGAILVAEKARIREQAEQRRLLYVGMTRAKDQLVLSGGLSGRKSGGTFLSLLEEAVDHRLGTEERQITIGSASIAQEIIASGDRTPRSQPRPSAPFEIPRDYSDVIARWQQRDTVWATFRSLPRRLTPSHRRSADGMVPSEEGEGEQTRTITRAGWRRVGSEAPARIIGTLAHRVLEGWDYHAAPAMLSTRVRAVCQAAATSGLLQEPEPMVAELEAMLLTFAGSAAYAQLRAATILGREIPFAIPWTLPQQEGSSCLMEGVIDVVYRLGGELWVVDYKTDRLDPGDLTARVEAYRMQGEVYARAVACCLNTEKVKVQLLFLRTGQAVELSSHRSR